MERVQPFPAELGPSGIPRPRGWDVYLRAMHGRPHGLGVRCSVYEEEAHAALSVWRVDGHGWWWLSDALVTMASRDGTLAAGSGLPGQRCGQ